MPAEWEKCDAVLIAWPHENTDWAAMLDDIETCYTNLVKAIAADHHVIVVAPDCAAAKWHLSDVDPSRLTFVDMPTNDTWTRDYGPLTIECDGRLRILDFAFNGWGLKFAADRDNLVTQRLHKQGILPQAYENRLGFVLEGGSVESDGRGTLLTTSRCLMSPNRNGDLSRDEIQSYLSETLGFDRFLWLDHGYLAGDDTDSHIDTLARIAPDNTILYVHCDDPEDEHFEQLDAMRRQLMTFVTRDGQPYNLVALPMPDAIMDEDGERLPATYANYLVTPKAVYMPTYGQPRKDLLAQQIIRIVFANHKIVPVDCRALIRQHGSLHCATMQLSGMSNH